MQPQAMGRCFVALILGVGIRAWNNGNCDKLADIIQWPVWDQHLIEQQMLNGLMWEVLVRVHDNGGIVGYHWLSLFYLN